MADVKLWNKGKSTIHGDHSDKIDPATQKPLKYAFKPQTAAAFSEKDAAKLRRLYPREILSMDDVQRQFEEKPLDKAELAKTHISVDDAERAKEEAVRLAVAAERDRLTKELSEFGLTSGVPQADEKSPDVLAAAAVAQNLADEAAKAGKAPEAPPAPVEKPASGISSLLNRIAGGK